MKTVFDKAVQDEIEARFQKLSAQVKGQWGKMNTAQMLAHCTAALQVPTGDFTVRPTFMSLIGWMFRGMIHSDKPFSRNSPTATELVMAGERKFDTEKSRFTEAFRKLAQGPSAIKCWKHSFFGRMSSTDWGCLMYKHVDHHFQQFGV